MAQKLGLAPTRTILCKMFLMGFAFCAFAPATLGAKTESTESSSYNKVLHHIGLRSFILPANTPAIGHVVATYGKALVQIAGDHIRLRFDGDSRPKVGDRIVIFDLGRELHHPHSGAHLGRLAQISGSAVVESVDGSDVLARIEKIVLELMKGQSALLSAVVLADAIDEGDDKESEQAAKSLDLFRDVKLRAPEAKLRGAVVAVEFEALVAGNERLAFIDRGSDDGLRLGDVIELLPRKVIQNKWAEKLGRAVVVATQAKTATTLVLSSVSEVEAGDEFITHKKDAAP